MAQIGDAKGEYRGLAYRNEAELKAWLAKRAREAALEPALPIIDPHHHFWDTPQRGRYLLPELLDDIGGGHNIVSTVFLECRSMYRKDGAAEMAPVGEVEFVNGIAAMSASGGYGACRVAEGIVGHADLTLGARVREVLEAEIQVGGSRFRGIRHGVSWDASDAIQKFATRPIPPHQLRAPKFPEGFAQLAPLGLSFESWQYHPQLRDAIPLAHAFPGTTIILNHVGGVLGVGPYTGRRQETLAGWKKDIGELARCPNVNVKLGGVGMTSFGLRLPRARPAAILGRARRRLAPVYRALHRGFWRQSLHVREQLSAGQAVRRLHRAVERLQAHHFRCVGNGKEGPLQRHCGAGVPPDHTLTGRVRPGYQADFFC